MNSVDDLCTLIARETGDAGTTIEPGTPLLETGIVDSLGVLKIVTAVETELGVEIPESQIVAARFRTPADLWEFVTSIRPGAPR